MVQFIGWQLQARAGGRENARTAAAAGVGIQPQVWAKGSNVAFKVTILAL